MLVAVCCRFILLGGIWFTLLPLLPWQLIGAVSASSVWVDESLPKISISLLGGLNYDIFYGQPKGFGACNQAQSSFPTPGCDSPLVLIRSVMDDVAKWSGNFTLISGGLMRHGTDSIPFSDVERTIKEVLGVISAASGPGADDENAPHRTVLALGVTDFSPANTFSPDVSQPHFLNMVNLMRSEGLITADEHSSMFYCGFYYRDMPGTKVRVVVLNTILWSTALQPPLGVGDLDPCGQFPFLHGTIEQAKQRGRSVIILGDMPPILNIAEALRKRSAIDASYYWRDDFRVAYFRIITNYRFTVAAQFFSSANTMGFVISPKLGPPMYIVPSISPVTGNNPSYLRATLDRKTGRVVTMRQRYLGKNGSWLEGDTLESAVNMLHAGAKEHSVEEYLKAARGEDNWRRFAEMRVGGRFLIEQEPCGQWCRQAIVCASLYYEKEDIDSCITTWLPPKQSGFFLAIVFTGIGAFVVCASLFYAFWHIDVISKPPAIVEMHLKRRFLSRSDQMRK
ncbi:hypothetical protein ERJ75_000709300 [Trypanosoma vivax]|uniref:Uncharacterized protein n=1 Tax=Trypanosoma vivax (strain Y486) TaxID=1055687 RepID=G0TTY8_TRYVY|nr:hypothetical protein TRVL_05648 [Trypanosoma vivax]KAH8614157.1 hypothetical protein ERJ75_000709300 [Trypanosoma vivax]CCC47421.1 conserved hypothetical protein [Trypanosoma vivax Y486]